MKAIEGYTARFGEGPLWDEEINRLLFVDLEAKSVISQDVVTGDHEVWKLPFPVTSVIKHDQDHYLLVAMHEIFLFNRHTEMLEDYLSFDLEPHILLNDAHKDSLGRIWVGTVDHRFKAFKEDPATALEPYPHHPARLYCIGPDRTVTEFNDELILSNGIAINEKKKKFYHVDSGTGAIWVMELEDGPLLLNRRRLAGFPGEDGFPDGMTMDANGDLWVALFKSKFVADRFKENAVLCKVCGETGQLLERVKLPVTHATSCAFGRDCLYVTTASELLPEDERIREPAAGKVIQLEVSVTGISEEARAFSRKG